MQNEIEKEVKIAFEKYKNENTIPQFYFSEFLKINKINFEDTTYQSFKSGKKQIEIDKFFDSFLDFLSDKKVKNRAEILQIIQNNILGSSRIYEYFQFINLAKLIFLKSDIEKNKSKLENVSL